MSASKALEFSKEWWGRSFKKMATKSKPYRDWVLKEIFEKWYGSQIKEIRSSREPLALMISITQV